MGSQAVGFPLGLGADYAHHINTGPSRFDGYHDNILIKKKTLLHILKKIIFNTDFFVVFVK